MRKIETLVGMLILGGMIAAIDCLPRKLAPYYPSHNETQDIRLCPLNESPALLCNKVTQNGMHECAICVDHSCMTQTGIWCAVSCDSCWSRSQ